VSTLDMRCAASANLFSCCFLLLEFAHQTMLVNIRCVHTDCHQY